MLENNELQREQMMATYQAQSASLTASLEQAQAQLLEERAESQRLREELAAAKAAAVPPPPAVVVEQRQGSDSNGEDDDEARAKAAANIAALEAQIKELQQRAEESSNELRATKAQQLELRKQLDASKSTALTATQQLESLRGINESLVRERDALQSQLETRVSSSAAEDELRTQHLLSSKQQEIDAQRFRIQSLESDLAHQRAEVAYAREQLDSQQQARNELELELERLRDDKKQLSAQAQLYRELQSELERQRSESLASTQRAKQLELQLQQSSLSNSQLEQQLHAARQLAPTLEATKARLALREEELHATKAQLESALSRLQNPAIAAAGTTSDTETPQQQAPPADQQHAQVSTTPERSIETWIPRIILAEELVNKSLDPVSAFSDLIKIGDGYGLLLSIERIYEPLILCVIMASR